MAEPRVGRLGPARTALRTASFSLLRIICGAKMLLTTYPRSGDGLKVMIQLQYHELNPFIYYFDVKEKRNRLSCLYIFVREALHIYLTDILN